MISDQRLTLARSALPFIASYCGRQHCDGLMPDYDLWTLRATLSPTLVAGSTVAEETVLAWLAAAPEASKGDAMLAGLTARADTPHSFADLAALNARCRADLAAMPDGWLSASDANTWRGIDLTRARAAQVRPEVSSGLGGAWDELAGLWRGK